MGLAKPYFDRRLFEDWDREALLTALVSALERAASYSEKIAELEQHIDDTQEPWL